MVDFAQPLSAFLQPARKSDESGIFQRSIVRFMAWVQTFEFGSVPFEHRSQNVAKEHQSFFASLHPFCQFEAPVWYQVTKPSLADDQIFSKALLNSIVCSNQRNLQRMSELSDRVLNNS